MSTNSTKKKLLPVKQIVTKVVVQQLAGAQMPQAPAASDPLDSMPTAMILDEAFDPAVPSSTQGSSLETRDDVGDAQQPVERHVEVERQTQGVAKASPLRTAAQAAKYAALMAKIDERAAQIKEPEPELEDEELPRPGQRKRSRRNNPFR